MKQLNKLLIGIFLCVFWLDINTLPVFAELDNDLQNWYVVTGTKKFWKRGLAYFEVQPRIGNGIFGHISDKYGDGNFQQLIIRPAVGVQVTDSISLWQGYGWIPTYEPREVNENRIFQQMVVNNQFSRLRLTNRTRLEERLLQDVQGASVRGRHMVRCDVPFGKTRKWAFVVSDELFITMNNTRGGPTKGFDQNRLFVGLNRKLSEDINMDIGYMNQYVDRDDPLVDRMNHILLVGLYYNFR